MKEGERLDDLQLFGMRILQKPGAFRFGTDAVILADFAAPKKGDKVVDLGTGTGILPLLMLGHVDGAHLAPRHPEAPTPRHPDASAPRHPEALTTRHPEAAAEGPSSVISPQFDAVEIQPEMADMARRSVLLNGLERHIRVHELDLRDAPRALGFSAYSLCVCNPPYSPEGTSLVSEREGERVSRHASDCTIEDVCHAASRLLRNGGRCAMVYPAARMLQLMTAMRASGMEPKRVRIVQDRPGAAPKLVLVDAVKGAGEMLHWMPPLVLKDEKGAYTEEWHRIYGRPLTPSS